MNSTALGAGAQSTVASGTALGALSSVGSLNGTSLGYQSSVTGANSVAVGANSTDAGRANTVSIGKAGAERSISNVAAGTLGTDAANVNQVKSVATNTGMLFDAATGTFAAPAGGYVVNGRSYGTLVGATTGLGNDVAANSAAITVFQQQVASGSLGLVQQSGGQPSGNLTVGAATGGTSMSMAGTSGPRVVTGVADGTIGAGSRDVVTGNQLNQTNQAVAALGTQVVNLSNTVATTTTMLQNGTTGMVQQVGGTPAGVITVGGATGGTTVSVAGTGGARTVTGVADGKVAAGSQDAVTGNQLNGTNNRVAAVESTVTTQGAQLTVLGGQSTAQGSRLTSVETTVAGHTAAITGLQSQVSGVQGRVDTLEKKSDNLTKGIAASMAMPSLSIPNGRKAAFGMDVSTYDGKQGVGASAAVALDKTWSVQGSVGGTFQGGDVGARAGVRAAW